METISIRRKGYPIRHLFRDFVDRYRLLAPGIGPSHCEGDCRSAAEKICKAVLVKEDYQIGKSKVFLKVTTRTRISQHVRLRTDACRTRTMSSSSKLANKSWLERFSSSRIPFVNGSRTDSSPPYDRVSHSFNATAKATTNGNAFKSCAKASHGCKHSFIRACSHCATPSYAHAY